MHINVDRILSGLQLQHTLALVERGEINTFTQVHWNIFRWYVSTFHLEASDPSNSR